MGTQRLNYRQGSDTGERDDANAIQPISDGERVWAAVANRPGENIRGRTESARSVVEDLMYRADTDIKWMIRGGGISGDYMLGGALPAVADWYPEQLGAGNPAVSPLNPYRGEFVIDSPIILEGVLSPGKDMPHVEELYAENAVPPRSYTVYLTSKYQAAAGGDTIRVRWRYEDDTLTPFPSGYLSVYASGDPIHVINVDVAGDGSVTLQQVEVALAADPDIPNLVTITDDGGDTGTVIDTTDTAAPVAGEHVFNREYQRELHLISPGVLSAFFGLNPAGSPYLDPNKLKDGDTVGILYPYIKDSEAFFGPHGDDTKVGGRRQATLTNNALPSAPVEVDTSQLFNSSQHPEYVSQAIPLCKRIGDDLIFIDGTVIEGLLDHTAPGYPPGGVKFGEHGHTVNRIVGGSSSILVTLTEDWFGGVPLSSGSPATLEAVINAIIEDLASTSLGSALIGSDESLGTSGASVLAWNFAANSLYNQLLSLQTSMNARAALDFNETVSGHWHFAEHNRVDKEWYHSSSLALARDNWYTFNPVGASPYPAGASETYWKTVRHYYSDSAGTMLSVYGGDWTAPLDFLAAKDDVGTGAMVVMMSSVFGVSTYAWPNVSANTTYSFGSVTNTFEHHSYQSTPLFGGRGHSTYKNPLVFDKHPAIEGLLDQPHLHLVASESLGNKISPVHAIYRPNPTDIDAMLLYQADILPEGPAYIEAHNCRWNQITGGWSGTDTGAYAWIVVRGINHTRIFYKEDTSTPWCTSGLSKYDSVGVDEWDEWQPAAAAVAGPYTVTSLKGNNVWGPPLRVSATLPGGSPGSWVLINNVLDWRLRHVDARIWVSGDADLLGVDAAAAAARNVVKADHKAIYFGDGTPGTDAESYSFTRIYLNLNDVVAGPLPTYTVELAVNFSTGELRGRCIANPGDLYIVGYLNPSIRIDHS